MIIPRDTFYTTDISVTLWILNNNKKARIIEQNGVEKQYRDRVKEILFMDLRKWGSEVDKKFIELTVNDIEQVSKNYHNWQQLDYESTYKNIPEYCYSASFEEVKENDFSLVPSKYIEFLDRDSNLDFNKEMIRIQKEFKILMEEETKSQVALRVAFKGLGYEI